MPGACAASALLSAGCGSVSERGALAAAASRDERGASAAALSARGRLMSAAALQAMPLRCVGEARHGSPPGGGRQQTAPRRGAGAHRARACSPSAAQRSAGSICSGRGAAPAIPTRTAHLASSSHPSSAADADARCGGAQQRAAPAWAAAARPGRPGARAPSRLYRGDGLTFDPPCHAQPCSGAHRRCASAWTLPAVALRAA